MHSLEIDDRDSLAIDEVFPYDLLDESGTVMLRAGRRFTLEVQDLLVIRGCRRLYFRPDVLSQSQCRPYDQACAQVASNLLRESPKLVAEYTEAIHSAKPVDPQLLDPMVANTLDVITKDAAPLVAELMQLAMGADIAPAVRSVCLSSLSMVVAEYLGTSAFECRSLGKAGLLHDISLPDGIPNFDRSAPDFERQMASYCAHPSRSIDLLRRRLVSLTDLEVVLMGQVHEQCDGSGFPNALRKRHLHPLSCVLNAVDAFLTLTVATDSRARFVPADALAYLAYHAVDGCFDLRTIQALISVSAVYPIGTQVQLSDKSLAVVLRSTGRDYCKPVIRRMDPANEIVDLRDAAVEIEGPTTVSAMKRLPKRRLAEKLWVPFA
ncbi:MAG: hypothetical protein R3C53_04245 [Pirellulaceae bacterium]